MALIDGLISQWLANNNGDDSIGPHNMSSVSPSGYTVDAKLGSAALIYNGVIDKSVVPNDADFNFGDASTDRPFSIFAWVKMTDASNFRIMTKGATSSAVEFLFYVDSTDRLDLDCYDLTTANRIRGKSVGTFTADQGTYILVGATYDGSGLASGIKLYRNLDRIDASPSSAGSYTAMHPLTADVWVGGSQAFSSYANGLIDTVYIWDRVLSDGGVAEGDPAGAGSDVDLLWNGGAGIEIGVAPVAAGRRRRMLIRRN